MGDGKIISIWNDRWPGNNKSGKITSPKPNNCQHEMVSDLIQEQKWKVNITHSLFSIEEAIKIMAIPLSMFGRKDRYIWYSIIKGYYSTKTGYVGAKDMVKKMRKKGQQNEETSNNKLSPKIWHQVWDLNRKHKVKHFLWKCLHDILPAHENVF